MASVKELVRSAGGNMSFIDYQGSYKDDNKEFLRGDMWEFSFEHPPRIVYYPGKDLINKRLNAVNISLNTGTNGFEKRMRGNYTIMQKTGQMTNGQLALQFIDKEDQAISYFVDDWRQKIADRDTKYSFRKDDVVADCRMILTNSSRKTVRTINFWNCIIDDAPLDLNGVAEDGTDRADVQLTMSFEHYDLEWNNI